MCRFFPLLFACLLLNACRTAEPAAQRTPADAPTLAKGVCKKKDEQCQILHYFRPIDLSNPQLRAVASELSHWTDADKVQHDRRLILLGETHGTNEMPELTGELVNQLSHDYRVNVGIEYPSDMQRAVDQFMATGNESVLLATKFFQNPSYHSGRGSRAMVAFL